MPATWVFLVSLPPLVLVLPRVQGKLPPGLSGDGHSASPLSTPEAAGLSLSLLSFRAQELGMLYMVVLLGRQPHSGEGVWPHTEGQTDGQEEPEGAGNRLLTQRNKRLPFTLASFLEDFSPVASSCPICSLKQQGREAAVATTLAGLTPASDPKPWFPCLCNGNACFSCLLIVPHLPLSLEPGRRR